MAQQEELMNQLAQRIGITPEQARTTMNIVSKTLLQKSDPNKASSLLSKFPSSITSMFSDNEKREFTTTQQKDITNEQVIQRVKTEAGISDQKKAQQATEESVKLLQENTGEQGLLDNVMGKFGKMDLNPFDKRDGQI